MLNKFFINRAKKAIIKNLNRFLTKHREDASTVCGVLQLWSARLSYVCTALHDLAGRCADGQLDDAEIQATTTDLQKLLETWK